VRTLAIGDIHGCSKALNALLTAVAPTAEDQIIFLGDYVDRGEDSRGVIQLFLTDPRLRNSVFLRGNHELMMLEARTSRLQTESWQGLGGFETLLSYGAKTVKYWQEAVPDAHWQFLVNTKSYFETSTHIFVHASLEPDLELYEQTDWYLFWMRFEFARPHKSGKKFICGHTPQDDRIVDLGFAACVDTGAVYGGWLSCLDVVSCEFWQANEAGQVQSGKL
jgi:serine/threonine protein phosphatase 1